MSTLSPDQFPEHGYVSLNDHHEALNLERNYGGTGMHPSSMRKTGEKVDVSPDMRLIPGQSTVYAAAVHKYVERPNPAPIDLYREGEDTYVLEGHHRLVAGRLSGRTLRGQYWEPK